MSAEISENPASDPSISRNLQGGRFQKGQSGNPAGRVPGSRNKATLIREAALTERAVGLLNGLMDKAEAGDMQATRVVLRRVLPDAGPGIDLPPVQSPREIANALGAVAAATASGEITPAQANALTRTLELQLQALQRAEIQEMEETDARNGADLREKLEQVHAVVLKEQEQEAAEAEARGEPAPPEEVFPTPLARYMPFDTWLEASGMGKQLGMAVSPAAMPPRRVSFSKRVRESRGLRH